MKMRIFFPLLMHESPHAHDFEKQLQYQIHLKICLYELIELEAFDANTTYPFWRMIRQLSSVFKIFLHSEFAGSQHNDIM